MRFWLVAESGRHQGQAIAICPPAFLVGRDGQCQLRPLSKLVSRRHCLLRPEGNALFVCDLDTTNGTFVNDEPVVGERELLDRDRLRIGQLVFMVRCAPAAASAGPCSGGAPAANVADDDAVATLLLQLDQDASGATTRDGGADIHAPTHADVSRKTTAGSHAQAIIARYRPATTE